MKLKSFIPTKTGEENTHPSDMKLKVIAFHMVCGSTERLAQRGTSWSSRKFPSKVGSYGGTSVVSIHPTVVGVKTKVTVDFALI